MKLRICHIITQLELGGAQRNTLYTLEHLDSDRFEKLLLCGTGGLLDAEAERGPWTTVFVPSLIRPIRPWADLAALRRLYRELRRRRPHIVHTHSSKAGILGRAAAYAAGVPVILHTFHGFGFTPAQPSWLCRSLIALERACARLSTHLIYVSEDNRRDGRGHGFRPRGGDSLIRSGVAMAPTDAAGIREEIGVPDSAWLVGCVNNFKPQKNPRDLLRAALRAAAAHPSIHVAIAGDGAGRAQAQEAAAGQPGFERVHFLGWRKDARRLLAACDAYLLTSLWEGLPRSLVESFAEGRPAVAYAVNGVKDILRTGINGFAVAPGNADQAAEKLLWLFEHPAEARKMGEAGRRLVELEFDIDRMVRQQQSLYEDLYARYPLREFHEPRWGLS